MTTDRDRRPREPPGAEPPRRNPSLSGQDKLHFNPFATGLAVFTAVAIPIVVVGYTRPAGVDGLIIAVGILLGVIAGLIAGLWVDHRGGDVWRGPQL